MSDLIGSTISHYRIDELIGAGGMGTVYRAYDINLERPVALKLMHPQIANEPEFRDRLKAEAQAAANLDHPSIIQIYNFGETDEGKLYVAMEFIKDGSLRKHLQRILSQNAYLDLSLAIQIAVQIAEGLDVAHRNDIIHRDVKPGNIILKRVSHAEEAGFAPFRAVLTDFGLVQNVSSDDRRTQSGITMGTPIYMSPEQCEGRNFSGRSDLYSLGVVLYEMLVGRPPFEFGSLTQAMSTHHRGVLPPSVRESRPELPEALEQVVFKALEKSPADRFQTGREMADALRQTYFGLSDTPTRFWHGEKLAEDELVILPAPLGYELVIRTAGVPGVESVSLDKEEFGIGRNGENDLVLPRDGVSRHHARLEHTNAGWVIRALAGPNGTFLNGRRLQPGQPMLIRPGDPVRIGQYELWIDLTDTPVRSRPVTQIAKPVMRPSQMRATPRRDRPEDRVSDSERAMPSLFELYLDQTEVVVEPGFSAEMVAEVHNFTPYDDRVRLNVQGISPTWLTLPSGFLSVSAGETVEIPLTITPPRETTTVAGRHRFRIGIVSQRNAGLNIGRSANLMVEPFELFDVDIVPHQMTLPAKMRVLLTNRGNTPAEYRILAREPEERIGFTGERGRIVVQPGQTIENELELEAAESRWFGSEIDIPFEIEVSSASGATQVRGATARQSSSSLGWLPLALIMLVTFACGYLTLEGIDGVRNIASRGATSTPAPTLDIVANTTLFPTITTQSVLSATVTLPPSGDPDDNDGDGLSNESELLIGSDPNAIDSDGDGLLDGAELLTYGSDPTKEDTDADGLLDGDEVTLWGTNPNSPDTDNDGISDEVELQNGTNPTVPNVIPTPTPFVIVATDDPNVPTITATFTPTPLPTFTPTVIPTLIATATETPPSPVVPDTPTPTPTIEIPTALPTATPTLTPTVAQPTQIPTETPTLTPTVQAATETPTPTIVSSGGAAIALQCTETVPAFDGVIFTEEFGQMIDAIEFVPNSPPIVRVYARKDVSNFYFAFEVTDDPKTIDDSIHIHVDVNGNGGDPDAVDALYIINFSSQKVLFDVGQGTNGDGVAWNGLPLELAGSTLVVTEDSFGWTIESSVALPSDLSGQFSMMVQAKLLGDGEKTWPADAAVDTITNWQLMDNSAICTP